MSRVRRHRTRKHRVLDKIRDELKEPHRATPPDKKQPAPAGEVASIKTPSRSRYRPASSKNKMSYKSGQVRRAPDLGLVRRLMADSID